MNSSKLTDYRKKIIIMTLIIIFVVCFDVSIINIINVTIDNKQNSILLDEITETTKIEEINDNYNNIEIIEQEEEIDEEDPYWDYIKMNLINVDFSELKQENSDTVGWIQVNGTNVNYPFVQGKDNKYYLNYSFDKTKNKAGWIFMDYRNNLSNMDKNTIIYGHSRLDKTMFGTLKNILTNGWLKNKDNYVIKLSTEHENTLWQVFSIYKIPTTNDYMVTEFNSNEEFLEFANMLKDRSNHDFNTSISENDYILTLSTCSGNYAKLVLHAKLIKRETR